MNSIGIDNGLSGAVVSLTEDLRVLAWFDTPTIAVGKKREFAIHEMAAQLSKLFQDGAGGLVVLEAAQAFPRQGASSTFKTGFGAGLWQGICAGLGLRFEVVHPRTWTKEVLRDMPAGETKERSMMKCQQLFPDIPLTKPAGKKLCMDGRADAACLALYGLRNGGSQ